jgi:hypothetical protein
MWNYQQLPGVSADENAQMEVRFCYVPVNLLEILKMVLVKFFE